MQYQRRLKTQAWEPDQTVVVHGEPCLALVEYWLMRVLVSNMMSRHYCNINSFHVWRVIFWFKNKIVALNSITKNINLCSHFMHLYISLLTLIQPRGVVAPPPPCSFSPVSFSRIFFHRTSPHSWPYIPLTHFSTFVMWVPMYPRPLAAQNLKGPRAEFSLFFVYLARNMLEM